MRHIARKIHACASPYRFFMACVPALCIAAVTPGYADPKSAKELAQQPGVIFARELADVPGKNLVVSKLEFPPKSPQQSKDAPQYLGHRHPGSTYVYVLMGTMRLGLAGQPVQLVHAGESFFEPVGAVHTIAESASATEPASLLAVFVADDGAKLTTYNE